MTNNETLKLWIARNHLREGNIPNPGQTKKIFCKDCEKWIKLSDKEKSKFIYDFLAEASDAYNEEVAHQMVNDFLEKMEDQENG